MGRVKSGTFPDFYLKSIVMRGDIIIAVEFPPNESHGITNDWFHSALS